jgi:Uma2 family endonuclease
MMPPMPRVPPFDRPATYDDLAALPDTVVAEIVNGELHSSPRPGPPHGEAGVEIGGQLVPPFHKGVGGPGGWRILYEPELHLGVDVLVPDWAGWRRERLPHRPTTAYYPIAPDWVCEILSPSTAQLARTKKLAIYARECVAHAWLIDPSLGTLEVLRLENDRWTILATHHGAEIVRAQPFDEIELDLGAFWSD